MDDGAGGGHLEVVAAVADALDLADLHGAVAVGGLEEADGDAVGAAELDAALDVRVGRDVVGAGADEVAGVVVAAGEAGVGVEVGEEVGVDVHTLGGVVEEDAEVAGGGHGDAIEDLGAGLVEGGGARVGVEL